MNHDRAERAKLLLAAASHYPRGCSDFVTDVLQIPWQDANSLMGVNEIYVGINGVYLNVTEGDIVGWKTPDGHGHVAIAISATEFIDVRSNHATPRKIHNYGPQKLYKSRRD